MPERVWLVHDDVDGDLFITVCASREVAINVAIGIIKDWHDGESGQKHSEAFLVQSRQIKDSEFYYHYHYDGESYTIAIKSRQVIG